ncbi:MAG: sulfotransferase [Acidimicrobiia bacterium]
MRERSLEGRQDRVEGWFPLARAPIVVTGVARAGTSWVAEMIKASGRFVHLNEPVNPKHPPGLCPGILNAPVPHMYLYVSEANEALYRRAFFDMLSFRYHPIAEVRRNRAPFDLAKMGKYWSAFLVGRLCRRRALLDDPYAAFASGWLARTFGARVIVLVRRPEAMVASYRRLGYKMDFHNFLAQPHLMREHLEPSRSAMESTPSDDGDVVGQVSLLWRAVYGFLAEEAQRQPDLLEVVRYEDLSREPVSAYAALYQAIGLPFTPAVEAEVVRATSGGSQGGSHVWRLSRRGLLSRTAFRPMDSRANLESWKALIDPSEEARIRELTAPVLDRFYPE